jgi:hypothetical protein
MGGKTTGGRFRIPLGPDVRNVRIQCNLRCREGVSTMNNWVPVGLHFAGRLAVIGGDAVFVMVPIGSYNSGQDMLILLPVTVLFGGLGLILFVLGISMIVPTIADFIEETPTVSGRVAEKNVAIADSDDGTIVSGTLRVQGQSFEVEKSIYEWAEVGQEVVISYWARSDLVTRVDKVELQ